MKEGDARDLNVPGEQQLKGKGVSYCAVCDGPLFKQKVVAVVGVGDPSLDAALLLKGIASKVYIIYHNLSNQYSYRYRRNH